MDTFGKHPSRSSDGAPIRSKNVDLADLIDSFQALADGLRVVGARLNHLLAVANGRMPPADMGADFGALTPREIDVLRLVAAGFSDREIAARLFISPRTAATHVSNILGKLGLPSRSAAAAYAARSGLG